MILAQSLQFILVLFQHNKSYRRINLNAFTQRLNTLINHYKSNCMLQLRFPKNSVSLTEITMLSSVKYDCSILPFHASTLLIMNQPLVSYHVQVLSVSLLRYLINKAPLNL